MEKNNNNSTESPLSDLLINPQIEGSKKPSAEKNNHIMFCQEVAIFVSSFVFNNLTSI